MKLFRASILIVGTWSLIACSSGGIRIVDTGFSAVETSPSRFVVKIESDEIRSKEEAEANLLVHSARWTIDHSGVYFTISDRIEDRDSEIDLEQDSTEASGTGVPTVTQPATGGYTSSTTGKRRTSWTVRATLMIYRDKPEGVDVPIYDAGRVLDEIRDTRGALSSSRVTVSSRN